MIRIESIRAPNFPSSGGESLLTQEAEIDRHYVC
jgi:hypothetical protein